MLRKGDIDIDFADRSKALRGLRYTPASIARDGKLIKHNTGVYFHDVPSDPLTGICSIDYSAADRYDLFKIDLLNVGVYELVRDEKHLLQMMSQPLDWSVFEDAEFVKQLFHLNNHWQLTNILKPRSVEQIAMLLALIRPGKRHLQDLCKSQGFDAIRDRIWIKNDDDTYEFKKSHAHSYAVLVYVHANLLLDQTK